MKKDLDRSSKNIRVWKIIARENGGGVPLVGGET